MRSLRLVSDALMSPASGLADPVERGTARLLSACILGMTALFAALDVVHTLTLLDYTPPWQGYVFLFVSYILSRTTYYRLGATLTTAMFPVVALSMFILGNAQATDSLSYVLLSPFFAGLFFGVRGAAVFGLLTPTMIAIVPLVSQATYLSVIDDLCANAVGGLVAVSYALHRDWVEQRRREGDRIREVQLIQLQKMEAIGRMAGGIAHDFNNLLTVISGGVELLGRTEERKELRLIESATNSARNLTAQLLTLSRQNVVEHASTDLCLILDGTEQLLSRIIGEDIRLVVNADAKIHFVALGESQLQQILLNLATNARDAMPRGGTLEFSAANDGNDFVRLSVRDEGVGMSPEVRSRIFEPFFTTKPVGRGTGLGLSMVFGLVTQSGGTVEVTSAVGQGTTFHLRLKRAEHTPLHALPVDRRAASGGGGAKGTILLVEDDAGVRETCRTVLRREGYEVLEAQDAKEALDLYEEAPRRVDLAITDVVMPGASGVDLAETLLALDPDLLILFVSGYAPEDTIGKRLDARRLLQKPFRPTELIRRVSTMLFGLDSQVPPARTESAPLVEEIPKAARVPEPLGSISSMPAGSLTGFPSEIPSLVPEGASPGSIPVESGPRPRVDAGESSEARASSDD